MSRRHGLTVSEALARIMVAERIEDEVQRRIEYRKILVQVRALGYHDGYNDGVEEERDSSALGQ